MRALVVGASGLVGGALLGALGLDAVGTYLTRPRAGLIKLDARDRQAFREALRASAADVIYLPAAQPNVEWCELEPVAAREANLGPVRGAMAAAEGRAIVAYSTDYVFDGGAGPYGEDDPPAPLNAYGRIKLEMERSLLEHPGNIVVRTTGVFGKEVGEPKNFVLRLLASLARGEEVRVPSDQVSTPTYAPDLATASLTIAEHGGGGIWHVTGPDLMPRTDLARLAARTFGLDPDLVVGTPTSELGQHAPRPLLSGLLCSRYEARFGSPGRPLHEALRDFRHELRQTSAR